MGHRPEMRQVLATMGAALAKKTRTPLPPKPKRPVQAPKLRTTPRDPRRKRMIAYGLVASALAIAAVVAALIAFGGGSDGGGDEDAVAALRAAGYTYTHPPSQGRTHVAAVPAKFKPNSVPRSSGPHSNQTIIYGAYTEEVPEVNAVHNLEHGAVIIYFGPQVPQSTIDEINAFYNEDPNGLIVSKHSQLGDEIALVSWTHVARGKGFDEDATRKFIDAFGFKGPESCSASITEGCFRKDNMKPGGP
jgi:Protein of unknown function (DUF3105)